jgi:acyl-CoA thioesterase FadM
MCASTSPRPSKGWSDWPRRWACRNAFAAHAGSTLLIREQHIRFLREAHAGAALHMTGGVLEINADEARVLMLLWHSDSAAPWPRASRPWSPT